MNKMASLSLASVMALSVVAGCSGNEGKEAGGGTAPNAPAGTPAKKTFTALLDNNATFPYSKDWPIWKWLEEKTGATLQVQTPSGKLNDTLNLTIASNNLPDLMSMPSRSDSDRFGQQGALVNILDYLGQMPNLKKWMEKYPDEAKAMISADGKMYMFPNQGFGETNRMIWLYREDIFKKNGLTPPKTYEELYQTMKKLKQAYPDSYPLSLRFGQIPDEMYTNLTTNFGTGADAYYDFDKKEWRYGPIEDNYKAMVEMWHRFYAEGLIPPDFLSIQTKQWQDTMSTDKSFITIDYISRVDFFNNAMKKDRPEYNMQFMAPPAGLNGGKQLNPYFHYLDGGLTVASTSKNIKDVMTFMDFFYTEEGRTLTSWGKEGETYVMENGQKKFKPEFTDVTEMRKKTGLQSSRGTYTWIDYNAHLSLFSKDLQNAYKEAAKYDPPAMQPRPSFTEKENEVLSVTGQALKKHREENFAKFVLGTRSMSEWSKYVEEMNNLGVQKLVDTYKAAYKRVESTQLKP
ncbi:extracellular solute-binding protein [Paenibacillus sp. OAS669]|uniref:extracellular solute-binding protein n=1 Tax=Paenibacillus sp. OAS669 TaxID=2663821 RepID=UPI00178AED9A|nr:extracellular solute-binding protein [Paenibacillus sp. OAS669]MBE1444627.1 putative aldouronate transport system substrate-binding protein [Paenibacillus sp. OAS669]